ncbi:hypothetical protein LZ31DRAFT_593633 [Colletotrichum somersetense]|nr:hypothetical protein LZ31DRAFT_593633 [Colletotrichum somersetense]
MQSSRFQSITSHFSPSTLRTTFRRSSTASSRASSDRGSYATSSSSPVSTINSIIFRQPSMLDLEEERKSFGSDQINKSPWSYQFNRNSHKGDIRTFTLT